MFFITGCCVHRGRNQLCVDPRGRAILDNAKFYHDRGDCFIRLFLLMPDHFHALIAPSPDVRLSRLLGNWKRFTTSQHGIAWQKNFVDHRLRSDESLEAKLDYIRRNPVRAGLIGEGETWPWLIAH